MTLERDFGILPDRSPAQRIQVVAVMSRRFEGKQKRRTRVEFAVRKSGRPGWMAMRTDSPHILNFWYPIWMAMRTANGSNRYTDRTIQDGNANFLATTPMFRLGGPEIGCKLILSLNPSRVEDNSPLFRF
jgi:hypothetical protein